MDQHGNVLPIETSKDDRFELLIPRDPTLLISSMFVQDVTSMNNSTFPHHYVFNLNYINLTSSPSVSIHLEVRPLNISLSYLLIYQFDRSPILNTSFSLMDGWAIFCPSSKMHSPFSSLHFFLTDRIDLTSESLYTYFIDNEQTLDHQSLIFGLRELNSTEMISSCLNASRQSLPVTNERFSFTCNYELRLYTSGCYYLDENNRWKFNGMQVGSLTNHYQTQCYSTHLTEFASGFRVLPEPINWNYVFANGDFLKNKTIYLTVIIISILYILLIIYSRLYDRKDLEKVTKMF